MNNHRLLILLLFPLTLLLATGCEDPRYVGDGSASPSTRSPLAEPIPEQSHRDIDCDGTPDEDCVTYTFGPGGDSVMIEADPQCVGQVELRTCVEFSTDARGRVLERGFDEDCEGDGLVQCASFVYDSAGRQTLQQLDPRCDGLELQCRHTEYDARGNVVQIFEDDCDGNNRRKNTHFEYDARGNMIRSYVSADDRGPERDCRTQTFNLANQLLSTAEDNDCDGQPDDVCSTLTHNAQGDEQEVLIFDCETGQCFELRRNSFNARGQLVEAQWGRECDAEFIPFKCERYQYDTQGNRTLIEKDPHCDGTDRECVVVEF